MKSAGREDPKHVLTPPSGLRALGLSLLRGHTHSLPLYLCVQFKSVCEAVVRGSCRFSPAAQVAWGVPAALPGLHSSFEPLGPVLLTPNGAVWKWLIGVHVLVCYPEPSCTKLMPPKFPSWATKRCHQRRPVSEEGFEEFPERRGHWT